MKLQDSTGQQLYNLEFDGRGKETYLAKAVYADGTEVSEEELEEATKGLCLCYDCRESSI